MRPTCACQPQTPQGCVRLVISLYPAEPWAPPFGATYLGTRYASFRPVQLPFPRPAARARQPLPRVTALADKWDQARSDPPGFSIGSVWVNDFFVDARAQAMHRVISDGGLGGKSLFVKWFRRCLPLHGCSSK
jgi:hypothetical protein